jgi:hypothetical protein
VPPGVIHQNLPHGARGDAEEVGPVAVLESSLIRQPEVGLVDQARGAEGVTGALAPKGAMGDPARLLVDQRNQPGHDVGMAAAQLEQQLGDGLGVGGIG